MYVKFQYFETCNCLHKLSTNTKSDSGSKVGVSVPLQPISKTQKPEHPNGATQRRESKHSVFIRNPDAIADHNSNFSVKCRPTKKNNQNSPVFRGKDGELEGNVMVQKRGVDKSQNFGVKFRPRKNRDGVQGKLVNQYSADFGDKDGKFGTNGVTQNGRIDKSDDIGFKIKPGDGCNGSKGGDFMECNGVQYVFKRNSDGASETKGKKGVEDRQKSVDGGAVERVKAKCSTKWVRYGGCIPAILEALENESDLDEAFRPWETSLSNKERSIILKEQEKWERALEIFEWFKLKGCYEVNVIHYNIMFKLLGRVRRWGEIERLWDEMKSRRIDPVNSTYGTLIDVYAKGGHREKAMMWLGLMNERHIEPDEVTMGIIVQMFKKAGEFRKAEEFFKQWSARKCLSGKGVNVAIGSSNSSSQGHVCLSLHTYNTLIDTYGKAGQVKEACQTFERMLSEGVVPTTVTFNTMIHMCGNNGHLDKVASFMKKMQEIKCTPDTRTYNILISLYAKNNNIDMSVNYFKEMKEASLLPDVVSYRTLLYAFSIRHMISEAEELVSEMDERGLQIDEFTQSALTRMYIEVGLLEKSWSWFQRFHLAGNMTSECYSANIDAFGERGHYLEAEKVFNCSHYRRRLTVLEFNVMIKAYGISKRYDDACCLFDSMDRYGVHPDRCSYNSLVQMLAAADLPHKAKSYLVKMQEAGLVDDCIPYCAVISSFAKLGQLEIAEELYKDMIAFNIPPDVVVYGVLINAFADMGSVKKAMHYLDAMRSAGLSMNAVIYNSLIKLYTKVGYLKETQEAYKMLQSFEVGPDVFSSNCMIDLYSERSMVDQAEEIFENLKKKGNANEFSYAMMLCMYKRNGRFVEAVRIAHQMRELGLLTNLLSYNHVLGLYAMDGRFKEAAALFNDMLLSDVEPDDSTFKALGIILLKCGVPKDAVSKLELMRKEDGMCGLQAWTSTISSVIEPDYDIEIDFSDDT